MHDLVPLLAAARSLKDLAKNLRKSWARDPRKKPRRSPILEKLGKTGDRRGNLADKFVSGLLADIGKDLPPDGLHLAHAEAKTSEPGRQAREAAAHRADQPVEAASAAFPGCCVGSLGRAWHGREQGIDLGFWSLLAKERENRLDRFFRNVGFHASGGGNAGDQIFHLKPRRCAFFARTCHPAGDKIKAVAAVSRFANATILHRLLSHFGNPLLIEPWHRSFLFRRRQWCRIRPVILAMSVGELRPMFLRRHFLSQLLLCFACGVCSGEPDMSEHTLDDGSIGRLLSDGGQQPSTFFDSHGDFLYFVPRVPTGRRTPEPGLVIGFIDSGTTSHHPQLEGLVIEEKSFVDGPAQDEVGHGTWCMLVSLSADPGKAFGFYSAKVTRDGSALRPKTVIAAFDWLVSKGVKVINMSLGFERRTLDVDALCRRIQGNPSVIVIAAAGNSGPDVKVYPAACGADNVLSVGELRDRRPTSTSGQGQVYGEPPRFLVRWAFLLEQGREAWRAGRRDEARDLWMKSLNDTENPGALFELGVFEANSGRWKEARPYIARAAEMAPDNAEILQTMGAIFFAVGEDDAAIEWYERALVIDPKNARALANLARSRAVKWDRPGAREMLDRLRAVQPDHPHIPEIEIL